MTKGRGRVGGWGGSGRIRGRMGGRAWGGAGGEAPTLGIWHHRGDNRGATQCSGGETLRCDPVPCRAWAASGAGDGRTAHIATLPRRPSSVLTLCRRPEGSEHPTRGAWGPHCLSLSPPRCTAGPRPGSDPSPCWLRTRVLHGLPRRVLLSGTPAPVWIFKPLLRESLRILAAGGVLRGICDL